MKRVSLCVSLLMLAGGCGTTEASEVPPTSSRPQAVAEAESPGPLADLRGLSFGEAKATLRAAGMTWRWIAIQSTDRPADTLDVCRQEPAPGATGITQAAVAIAEDCGVVLRDLRGMSVGEATKLLDADGIAWQLEDGIDIDFPESLDSAPPHWHVCGGDSGFAVEDAVAFLASGESMSGTLYGDGEAVVVFLQVAPDASSCYTTNDGEEP